MRSRRARARIAAEPKRTASPSQFAPATSPKRPPVRPNFRWRCPPMRRLVLLLALLAPGTAGADDETPTVEAAIVRSKETGQPLILECGTEWCVPCKTFEKRVL